LQFAGSNENPGAAIAIAGIAYVLTASTLLPRSSASLIAHFNAL
jgi:hypothetical protein